MAETQKIRAGRAYVELSAEAGPLDRGLAQAQVRLKAFGQTATSIGAGMAGVGSSVIAPIAMASKVFASYDQALADLRAAANPTAEQYERIKAAIDAVSKSTGKDQTTTAGAFSELLKAGMSIETVLGGAAEQAVKFARVGNIDVATAAVVMSDALNVFGKSGLTAAQATDILSKAADASTTSIEQNVQAFSMSSAVWGSAGQSIGDLASATGILGNAGLKGSDAGTSLKTMMLSLSAPTAEAAAVMDRYGLSVRDASGKILPMRKLLEQLQGTIGGLGQEAKDDAIKQLFGTDAYRAATILMGQGTKGWDEFQEKLQSSLSVADKFKIQAGGMNDRLEASWASVTRLGTAVGGLFSGPVSSGLTALNKVVTGITDWAARNKDTADSIAKLVGGVGALLVAGGAVAVTIGGISMAAGSAVSAIRGLGSALSVLGAVPAPALLAAAAVGALGYAYYRANTFTAEYRDTAKQTLEQGDQLRRQDQEKLDRLQKLGEADKLNIDQQKEAKSLIDQLQKSYGDLGLSIDATTGKVLGLEQAQNRLNLKMKEAAIAQAKAAVTEAKNNYDQAQRALDAENKNNLSNIKNAFNLLMSGGDNRVLTATQDERNVRREQYRAALANLAARESSLSGSGVGEKGGLLDFIVNSATVGFAKANAAAERFKASKLGDPGWMQTLAGQAGKFADETAAETEKLQAEERQADAQRQADALARGEDLWRQQSEFQDALKRQELEDAEEVARRKVDAAGTPEERLAAEKALLQVRRDQAREAARVYGLQETARAESLFADDPAALADAKNRIGRRMVAMMDLPDMAAKVEQSFSSRGTFSAVAAALLGGGTDFAKETAKNTAATKAAVEAAASQIVDMLRRAGRLA